MFPRLAVTTDIRQIDQHSAESVSFLKYRWGPGLDMFDEFLLQFGREGEAKDTKFS